MLTTDCSYSLPTTYCDYLLGVTAVQEAAPRSAEEPHPSRTTRGIWLARSPTLWQVGHSADSLVTTHYSLLTTHYSPLTAHCSLLTTHYSLLTTHNSLLTTHRSLLTAHYSLLTTRCSLLTTHCSLRTPQSSLLSNHYPRPTTHDSQLTAYQSLLTTQQSYLSTPRIRHCSLVTVMIYYPRTPPQGVVCARTTERDPHERASCKRNPMGGAP